MLRKTKDGDATRQKEPKMSCAMASCGAEPSAEGFPKCRNLRSKAHACPCLGRSRTPGLLPPRLPAQGRLSCWDGDTWHSWGLSPCTEL